MKYVIGFGAVCVVSGLAATFWLWWYAERSISLRTSPVSRADDNGIAQPLLTGEHGSSSAVDAIEAQQEAGAIVAPGADEQQEEPRTASNSSSGKPSPPMVETPAGETPLEGAKGQQAPLDSPATLQPPEASKTISAAQEEQEQDCNGSNSNSNSNMSGSPMANVGDDGGSQDASAGIESNRAGAGTEELGEPGEVPSSGESAAAR